jgi:hypothetical protein
VNSFSDIFGSRERRYAVDWMPSPYCAAGCGLRRADDYGYCWIHRLEFVVMTYRDGLIDALPIKQEVRRRMIANDYSQIEMAQVLGVSDRRLTRLFHPQLVWMRHKTADFWFTKLEIAPPAEFWKAA